jgi:hypothetical protein
LDRSSVKLEVRPDFDVVTLCAQLFALTFSDSAFGVHQTVSTRVGVEGTWHAKGGKSGSFDGFLQTRAGCHDPPHDLRHSLDDDIASRAR